MARIFNSMEHKFQSRARNPRNPTHVNTWTLFELCWKKPARNSMHSSSSREGLCPRVRARSHGANSPPSTPAFRPRRAPGPSGATDSRVCTAAEHVRGTASVEARVASWGRNIKGNPKRRARAGWREPRKGRREGCCFSAYVDCSSLSASRLGRHRRRTRPARRRPASGASRATTRRPA